MRFIWAIFLIVVLVELFTSAEDHHTPEEQRKWRTKHPKARTILGGVAEDILGSRIVEAVPGNVI